MKGFHWILLLMGVLALAACRTEPPRVDDKPSVIVFPHEPSGEPSGPPRTGALRTYATLYSAGLEWRFSGDPEGNASCTLRYRKFGEEAWQEAWPPYRIRFTPPQPVAGKNETFDGCAGSIFFLQPGTIYELWVKREDPDGADDQGLVRVRTHNEPAIPENAHTYHVVPGSGGGTGTVADPYRGIEEAQRHARPGDVFLLAAGEYAGFAADTIWLHVGGYEGRWVVWKAAEDGVVFTDPVRIAADYVWLEGVHLRGDSGGHDGRGLRTEDAPKRVVIKNNTFTGFHYSIVFNYGGEAWVIENNTIIGDKDLRECLDDRGEEIHDDRCPSASYGGEGIELNRTSGHTVAYNSISRVADGISYPLENTDIFGNEIFDVTDDGIEPDLGYANIRVWNNRITNARHNGLSFQPMNGGPWYFIRNQVAAPRESTLKLRQPSRVLLAHNLLIGWNGAVTAYRGESMRRIDSLNNLYVSVSGSYVWELYGEGPVVARLDHDGFDWDGASMAFKWDASHRYRDLAAFQQATGLEPHGLAFDRADCFTVWHVTRPPEPMPLEAMTLKAGCPAVDAGMVLPNITGAYTGAAPDLGPYERGLPVPHYGP